MRTLVMGAGVTGSYLAHKLAMSGNIVTVFDRKERTAEIRANGLSIRHLLQDEYTVNWPRTVATLDASRYDVAFVCMQYQDVMDLAYEIAHLGCKLVVLVGNDLSAAELSEWISSNSPVPKTVLFGYQHVAGYHEDGHIVAIHKGQPTMTIGPGVGGPWETVRKQTESFFTFTNYELNWEPRMYAWLQVMAALTLPASYAWLACGGDYRNVKFTQCVEVSEAMREGCAMLSSIGVTVPPNIRYTYESWTSTAGRRSAMEVLAKTSMGYKVVGTYVERAEAEIDELADSWHELRERSAGFAMPHWDKLEHAANAARIMRGNVAS